MKTIITRVTLWVGLLCIVACGETGEFLYGAQFEALSLNTNDPSLGIHPSQTVLNDPNNPFRFERSGEETKWDIESARQPIAAFYSWATWLATEPTGEHQYYVGLNLKAIYQRNLVPESDGETVRQLAIAAFRSVLDNFPDAVTYDITGTVAYPIRPDAFRALESLGGDPSPWSLVVDLNGEEVLVR
ncbi:MAG: hypothetical protein CMH52_10715 [Myxococcales bacterium]|nr:hypothetical protein [Myxococcales bacterium]